jgi:hypothetical protein
VHLSLGSSRVKNIHGIIHQTTFSIQLQITFLVYAKLGPMVSFWRVLKVRTAYAVLYESASSKERNNTELPAFLWVVRPFVLRCKYLALRYFVWVT